MTEQELELVPILCAEECASVDIGAYEGSYTEVMAKHSRIVHSFEPVEKRFDKLSRRRFVKGKNVMTYNYALSERAGQGTLYVPHFKNRFHSDYALHLMSSLEGSIQEYLSEHSRNYIYEERVSVETMMFDSFNFDTVGFIKIDVEGHELSVLKGARRSLKRDLPHLLIEIEDRYHQGGPVRVSKWLGRLGYAGYFIQNRILKPFEMFNMGSMQLQPLERIKHRLQAGIPGYVNNFLFFHESKNISDRIQEHLNK